MYNRSDTSADSTNDTSGYKVNMLIAGLITGSIAGTILLFLSYLAPYVGAGNFLGKTFSQREGQYIGILVHVISSALFGLLYAASVTYGIISDFSFVHLLEWSGVMTLIVGGIIMPLEGHGLFGIKEDAWFPIDLYITNLLWCVLYWWLIPPWLAVLSVS